MKKAELLTDLIGTYNKYGWQVRRLLLKSETRAEISSLPHSIPVVEAPVDAVWFSRPSHENREAWELRLLAETQYALFETFAPDESEEEREIVREEMETRLRDYVLRT